MKRLHYLLLSIISLATGIMVYILFHPVPLAFDLIPWINSFPSIQIHSPIIKQFTQCYAADLIWAVSFAFIIQCIVMISKKKAIWLMLTALLGISVELLQLLHIPIAFPSFGIKYVAVLNGMPPAKRSVSLVPLLVGKEWSAEILETWNNDSLTPKETKKAIEAMRRVGV